MSVRIRLQAAAAALGLGLAGAASAQAPAPPIDYANPATWVCRPGKEAVCTTGLDAMRVDADGTRTFEAFQPLADPPVDCFYVYPTISRDPGVYSDMTPSPDQEEEVTKAQAGRLTSRCRVFAPLYRQITMTALFKDKDAGAHADWRPPYRDVKGAFDWYMAHENHGRGVVLVGHSQGAILLQHLIKDEFDGTPRQRLLVSAFLAGDPVLPVPKGARVGGAFKSVPLCSAAAETGCVYVWADYAATDASPDRHFGDDPGGGMEAGCVNPAAPSGGSGDLKAYLPKPAMAPTGDPHWVDAEGQLSAACVGDAQGHVLRVTVKPGRYADLFSLAFTKYTLAEGWGLHRLDLSLPQGNILDVVAAESAAWTAKNGR
jgi:hypothetical protein